MTKMYVQFRMYNVLTSNHYAIKNNQIRLLCENTRINTKFKNSFAYKYHILTIKIYSNIREKAKGKHIESEKL